MPAELSPANRPLPTLRQDLRSHSQTTADGVEWVIEDPLRGEFYRLGEAEFAFASTLGQTTTLEETLALCQRNHPSFDLTPAEATELIQWLLQSHLLTGLEPTAGTRLAREHSHRRTARQGQWLNLFSIRVPLWKPGRELDQLTAATQWFFSPFVTILVLSFILGTLAAIWHQQAAFTASLGTLFVPRQSLWLLLAWIALKIVHEAGHAIVCRRYGGDVREAGALFILFVPAAYVDVSSAWRFASRWQRIHTAAAGMYVELTVAALAGWAWLYGENQWWTDLAAQVVLLSSVSTLLTNLNPLSRFDGYFMVADLLGIPNLAERGSTALKDWIKLWLLGVEVPVDSASSAQQLGLLFYGALAWFWRLTISLSLIAAAAVMFHGAGILLATSAVLLWFVVPCVKTTRYLLFGDGRVRPNLVRLVGIVTPVAAAVIAVLSLVPMPGTTYQPGMVEYLPEAIVRVESPGFVRQIHIAEGEEVQAGQLLVELENEPLQLQRKKLELDCERAAATLRRLQAQQRGAERESALAEWTAYDKQRQEIEQKISHLRIVAPHAGRVISRRLADRVGTYVPVGEELLIVGDHSDKQLRVSWTARDLKHFPMDNHQNPLELRLPTLGSVPGKLLVIEPRGHATPTHPALCSPFGGPLAAKRVGDGLEFLEPRFDVLLELPQEVAAQVRAGEIIYVRHPNSRTSIAQAMWEWCQRQTPSQLAWFEKQAVTRR